ncbi:Disease resistance protein (CC-NBS-LRR) [Rhynchospora pubera]|uniref:Disease resistance protein (CC-NBS-LRR) n=1 Tax=Rhynchospora pubera TaxID=906938 RepID=A0AAV8GN33_9POAL|nr:Disease resistance protein (CC-NBS-LRR) [Rhynchospora pubera]
MILQAFIGNISSRLTKMAADEVGMLLGIPGEIEKLGSTVRDIQCVLSDAEKMQIESSAIQRWLMELKDVMYDADDLIDTWQIKTDDSKSSWSVNLISSFSNTKFSHEIGTKIKELNSRLDEISKKKSDFGLNELLEDVRPFKHRRRNSDISLKTDPSVVQADVVGDQIEEDTQHLVKWLTTEESGVKENISAVAIVGMPGIGKTTLAKRIFNDRKIKEEFHLKFWVYVSKDLKGVELLKCVIRDAGGHHGAAEERSELVARLERLIQGKKFLLVLDDVWHESQNVWDGLLRVPMIGGAHGSRLLITTQFFRVARFMNAAAEHTVKKLSDKDAWALLVKQFSQVAHNENEILDLKDIGLKLVRKCDGLPLAVKAIGGVLRTRGRNIIEWQTILGSTFWSLVDLPNDFPRALFLSYEDLPSHLKQCFILCSLYPRYSKFRRSDCIYFWLAEGILYDEGNLSFYELGIEFYKELISRNLLEAYGPFYDQNHCTMHDLLRSFGAEYLAKNENYKMMEGGLISRCESSLKLRRLSIEKGVVDPDLLNKEKSIRTLILNQYPMSDFLSDAILSFSYLRIVDFLSSNISSLPDPFFNLVHLRYLSLYNTKLETLSNSIGKLKKLLYLNLGNCYLLSHVPSSIFTLLELKFLSFYCTNIKIFPMGFKNLEKLVEVYGFKPYKNSSEGFSSLEDLGTMSQLLWIELCNLDKALDITVAKKANLKGKDHLKNITFSYTSDEVDEVPKSIEETKAAEDVLNVLSPPPSLETLNIHHYFGYQLPNWLHVGTDLSKLKFLRYIEVVYCKSLQKLSPLGQLPNLDFLRVYGAESVTRIGREFFLDDSNEHIRTEANHFSTLPFPKLNELGFTKMSSWIEWLWEEGQPAMPNLKKLFIRECPMLSSLPKGLLRHATSLEFLEINRAENIKSIEDLQSVKKIYVRNNTNLGRISNLPNLSYIQIVKCPNLEILDNLNPSHKILESSDLKWKPSQDTFDKDNAGEAS